MYLVEDEPLTLVDTGPNAPETLDALERALAGHGRRLADLGLILVTHHHADHAGLVDVLARRSGAEVAALDRTAAWLAELDERAAADDRFAERLMLRHGVPAGHVAALRAARPPGRRFGAPATVTVPLADGEELRLRDRTLRAIHRPGHSPTDTLFLDPERRLLFGGDHLLGHISSNPLIGAPDGGDERAGVPPGRPEAGDERAGAPPGRPKDGDERAGAPPGRPKDGDERAGAPPGRPKDGDERAGAPPGRPKDGDERPRALLTYLDALRATRAMDLDVILPGHGDEVRDHVRVVDRRLRTVERRAAKIRGALAGGPLTAHELAHRLWGTAALTQTYLTLCEVLGHLDLLAARGEVVEEDAGDVRVFRAA